VYLVDVMTGVRCGAVCLALVAVGLWELEAVRAH
jgi:hypothetical protein